MKQKTQVTIIGGGPAALTMASFLRKDACAITIVSDGKGTFPLWSGQWDFRSYESEGHGMPNPWEWWERAFHSGKSVVSVDEWHQLWTQLREIWRRAGIPMSRDIPQTNNMTLTITGHLKPVFLAPDWQYVTEAPEPLVVVGIDGVVDASVKWMADAYRRNIGQPAQAIVLPRPSVFPFGQINPVRLAAYLDSPPGRTWFEETLCEGVANQSADWTVIVPQVLGIRDPEKIFRELGPRMKRPIYEYGMMPPAIGGMRIDERWRRYLRTQGVRWVSGHVQNVNGGHAQLRDGREIVSDIVILATGGILGGGLDVLVDGRVRDSVTGEVVGRINDKTPIDAIAEWGLTASVGAIGRQQAGWNPERNGDGGAMILSSVYQVLQNLIGKPSEAMMG